MNKKRNNRIEYYEDYYHYTSDAVGNRLTQTSSVHGLPSTVGYDYDDANRLSEVNGVTYTWDDNGNLLSDGVNTYAYDSVNRLTAITGPSVAANYSYNGLGDRIQETVNGNTTTFTMDLNTGVTQALSDGTYNYIYDIDRIAQAQGSTTEYFLGDALGSVRQLADNSGALTYARTYDPYGVVTSTSGSSQSAYGYTSEYSDSYIKLIYLRSRWYDPASGRFQTKDSWQGDYNRPLSLNRWNYTDSNPINYSDPSGHCFTATGKDLTANDWSRIFEHPLNGYCTDHSDDVISPNNPYYHDYSTDNVVCPAWLSCSQAEIADAMTRFAFPGQDSSKPIENHHTDSVWPFKGTPYEALGAIESLVSEDHLTTANIALSTHIFYVGRVDRQATLSVNGDWVVSTRGTGNNIFFGMDEMNQETGADIFNFVDLEMRIYITENHFKNWLKGPC